MEDVVEVTQVELRTMGIGPHKRLQVLARLKGESVSRLLFEESALGLDAGEIGHCAHVSGIRNAPADPLAGATTVDGARAKYARQEAQARKLGLITDVKLRPLGDRVLVRVAKAEEKVGAIIVPDAAQKKPRKGEVLAVGPGPVHFCADGSTVQQPPHGVHDGDVVLFSEYAGTKVGDDLFILTEADLIAVEEK